MRGTPSGERGAHAPGLEARISLRTVRRALTTVVLVTVVAGFWAEAVPAFLGVPADGNLVTFFSLSHEANFPTWVATCLLWSCAAGLALVSLSAQQQGAPYVGRWWLLAAVFAYISLDEAVQLHEEANDWFSFSGMLYFGWIIPAAVVVGVLALVYWPFLRHLPPRFRAQVVMAGSIYVGGALLLELPLGYWTSRHGDANFVYAMIDLAQEAMELTGAALFLYSLVERFGAATGVVHVTSRPPASVSLPPDGGGRSPHPASPPPGADGDGDAVRRVVHAIPR